MKMHFTKMFTVCCAILLGAFISSTALAQGDCLNTSSFGDADIALEGPNGELITIAANSWQTEYATITGIPVGEDIEFNYDSPGAYITVRSDSADGAVVAQGLAPVTVSGASGAELYAHWNTDDACGTAQNSNLTTVQCTSCGTICPDGNPGDACDDGDAATVGDVLGEDCVCAGVAAGGCLNTSAFAGADIATDGPNGELITLATNSWQTEYSTVTGVPVGEDIEFNYDSPGAYITVRADSADGAVVAEGFAPVTVAGASGSDLFSHWNTDDACGTAQNGNLSTVQCTSCGTICPDGNPGDACDDGDENTVGDILGEDCICAGVAPGGCLNTSSFGSADIATDGANGELITLATNSWQTEYSTVTGVPAGEDIQFNYDSPGAYITVRADSVDGDVVAEGFAPVTVAGASGSDLFSHWNTDDACGTDQTGNLSTVQCLTCGTDCPDGDIGDACDDGDENTENDVLGEDCVCAGTPIAVSSDCLNTSAFGGADISLEGSNGELITIATNSWQTEYSTITGVPAGEDIEFNYDSPGAYITVRTDSADGAVVSEGFAPLTVAGASGSDLFAHWNTNDTCGTAQIGNLTTVQCVTCATICPDGNPGDACDDGNENTVGDVIGEDCICAGTTPGGCLNTSAFAGADIATDGPNGELITLATNSWQTEYSTVTGVPVGEDIEFNYDSPGAYITVRADSADGAIVAEGFAPVTVAGASGSDLFPHWNTDDACGTDQTGNLSTVQCLSCVPLCPDGSNPGDACDDGNPLTSGETVQEDCSCGGGIVVAENDECVSSIDLVCGGSVDGTTAGATALSGLSDLCNDFTSTSAEDVWYAFEADGSSSYTVTVDTNAATSSSLMDAVIFVYSGVCEDLTEVGCADNNFAGGVFTGESFALDTPEAGTYYVRVFNWNAGGEEFTISLDCESGCVDPFPAVDEESLSTTFQGNSYLVEWASVEGQIGCQLQLRLAGASEAITKTIIFGEDASSQVIPGGILDFATDYEWRVRCGCSIDPNVVGPYSSWQAFTTPGSAITSLPNPTEGQSTVTFTVVEEGYTALEVFDMSGRLVDAVFTGNTQPNTEYRFEFDGSVLPNGVYVYRLTTENEVLNNKFMIAK